MILRKPGPLDDERVGGDADPSGARRRDRRLDARDQPPRRRDPRPSTSAGTEPAIPTASPARTIPLASRVTLVCDAYDAMRTDRPYRAAMSEERARAEIERHAGGQFCPIAAARAARGARRGPAASRRGTDPEAQPGRAARATRIASSAVATSPVNTPASTSSSSAPRSGPGSIPTAAASSSPADRRARGPVAMPGEGRRAAPRGRARGAPRSSPRWRSGRCLAPPAGRRPSAR